jgi:3-polyprenyl-4-hydroxybenzoate decarboxylase
VAQPGDLCSWIPLLEREGELVRVVTEVDPHLEVTEFALPVPVRGSRVMTRGA